MNILLKLFILMCMIAIFYHSERLSIKNSQRNVHKCEADLETTRYQLNAVTKYKYEIEHLLAQTRDSYNTYKLHFNDFMNACSTMKRHADHCQTQFDDLLTKCTALNQQFNKASMTAKDPKNKETGGLELPSIHTIAQVED